VLTLVLLPVLYVTVFNRSWSARAAPGAPAATTAVGVSA